MFILRERCRKLFSTFKLYSGYFQIIKIKTITNMSKKAVTLGEILLRLSTRDFKRFLQAEIFDVIYGGGEANEAAAF